MGFEEVVTFLIPTLNERDGIGLVIEEIKSLGFNKIIVVDGNSTDGTAEIAKEKGAKVIHQKGKGKALAMMTGLKHALNGMVRKIMEELRGKGVGEVVVGYPEEINRNHGNKLTVNFWNCSYVIRRFEEIGEELGIKRTRVEFSLHRD